MNIVEPVLFQCRYNPPAPAICAPGTEFNLVSYARLERFIHNVGRNALRLGLAPGDTVAIFVNDPILHAAIILGLTRLGIVTLSGRNPELPKEVNIAALIADTDFPYQAPRIIRGDASWVAGDGTPVDEERIPPTKPDDVSGIYVTSGSTGDPKAVAITHAMLADRVVRRFTFYGQLMMHCSRTFCGPGLSTSSGLQHLLFILWRGGTAFFSGQNLELLVRAFVDFEVENMVAAPATLASLLDHYEQEKSFQHRFKGIRVGSARLSPSLADRVRRRMGSNILRSYGTTETGVIASASYQAIADIPDAAGHVAPGVAVEIVDEADRVLPPETEGFVRIRSPANVREYIGDPAQTRLAFRDGWFYPGDLGRFTRDKLLVLSGRVKPVLNLGGEKVKPEMVEDVVTSFEGIAQAAVFGVPGDGGFERLWSAVIARSEWNEEALRAHCAQKLPPELIPVRFIVLDRLPLTPAGKIDRRRLAELAREKLN